MKNPPYFDYAERKAVCPCGKICFDKKTALSKKNWLEEKGRIAELRVYQCPQSDYWHLTHQLRRKTKWKK